MTKVEEHRLGSNHGGQPPGSVAPQSGDRQGTSAMLAATLFAAVAVLVFHATGSRSLGPDGFSPIAVLWTLMFLLHTVLLLPAEQHLTRALVVTRTPSQIRAIRRDMLMAALVAMIIGVGFVAATRERFFAGSSAYVGYIAAIVVSRAFMTTGRGFLAGSRRFGAYGVSIGVEAASLIGGGLIVALLGGGAQWFAVVMAGSPATTMLTRPFRAARGDASHHAVDAQPGSFLVWLIVATAASQLIVAGGPIAVSFVGGGAAAVSIFFTSFALLRGPLTSAYNLVARVLPDFTALAHRPDERGLWVWANRIVGGAIAAGGVGAVASGFLLRPVVQLIYGAEFAPPVAAAALGGAGVGLGLGALFASQIYSAAALGVRLSAGWLGGLVAALAVLLLVDLDPVVLVALAFAAGEGVGLVMLGLVLRPRGHVLRAGKNIDVQLG